jgi:diguanylate cyclase (GGDEF)-like protein/PAS domain S-box-containing protein
MLKHAEANLLALIESMQDLIWSVDLDNRLITFNKALQQNILEDYGVQIEAGMRFHEVLPPERVALWPAYYARALSEGPFRVEYTRIDGGIMELAFNPIVVDGEKTGISIFGKEITERKAVEESRRFLAEVVESCEEAIISNAPSGEILSWNHGAEILYGYTAAEMIGKPFSMIIVPELRALAARQFVELVAGTPLLETQGVALRKDGSRTRVSVTTWPIRNSAGEVTAICTIVRDISAHYEAEKNRALLASVVESSGDAVHAVNLDGTVASWNRGAEALFGYSYEEIIGRSVAILAPPGRGMEVPSLMGSVAQGEHVAPFDTFLRGKDGRNIDVSLSISPIRNSAGEVTGASAIARDISQHKQAERALQEAEKKYRDIFEEALEGMCQTTLEGRFLSANPAVARILGYDSPEELISTVTDMGRDVWVNPDERMKYLRLLEANGLVRGFECQLKRQDGRRIWVSLNDRLVCGADGRVLYLEGLIEDISERKRAEAELRDSLDSLKESQAIGGLGSYALDIGTGVWTSSDVLDDILGIGKDYEHTVAGWTTLIHPDDRAAMADYFAKEVAGKGRNFNKEYRIIRQKDQAERWVHGIGRLEFGGKGQPVKMRGVIKDITESKLSEKQLRDSEERYRTTFQMHLDAIDICQVEDGRFLDVNDAFVRITGFAREEVIGRTAMEIGIWADSRDRQKLLDALRRNQGRCTFEAPYRNKEGNLRWGLLSVSEIELDGISCILSITRDITDAKAAEERLAAASEALRGNEERYRAIFETSSDAVVLIGQSDGNIIDANQAFFDSLGYQRNEVIGHTTNELNLWVNDGDSQRLLDELTKNNICRNMEFLSRRRNGEKFWIRMSASSIEIGGIPCRLVFAQDITDAKAAEERLAAAAEALRVSEERYRSAFQTSLDAITINRLSDGIYIDCNQAFLDITGYIREEVLGRTPRELEIWANFRDRQTMDAMLIQNSSCRRIEVQFRKKNGEVFWGEMSASVMEIEGAPCVLSITRDLSAAKTAEKTIRSLAFYDPLTGLSNRRMLMERLRQPLDAEIRSGSSQALLLIDLDHFKTLNDTLGHQTGDLLLQEVARRIVACTHEADTVCRLGGDEFVVVLEDLSKVAEDAAAQAKAVGEKILAVLDQPFLLEDHECLSTASIGIAVFGDRHDSTDEILKQAEIALYQAKAAERNTLRFFSPALQAAVNTRAALEEDLRQAIKEKQFLLYYQPQVERGRLTGSEALIRWMHPKRGLVPPNDFIPLAEETRLILPIGDWVLEAACAQIALWAGRKDAAHLTIAVNISALQFRQPSFVEQVLATLRRTGANPDNLRLELTESMLVDNIEEVILKMTELKSHGLRFALDDFGTGYSSLAYLKRLPLDRLKIDRAFVRDMLVDATSGAIAQTILSLSRAMGISVIAEGVETEEQRGYLAALGCHSFQGFLISRPLPLENFEAFLQGFAESGGPR